MTRNDKNDLTQSKHKNMTDIQLKKQQKLNKVVKEF